MKRLIIILAVVPLLAGADCEERRLSALDNTDLVVADGVSLCGACIEDPPWTIYGDPSALDGLPFTATVEEVLDDFGDGWVDGVYLDQQEFDDLFWLDANAAERDRTVLVYLAPVTPGWDEPEALGRTDYTFFPDTGCLYSSEISVVPSLSDGDFRAALKHELGHAMFALAHDPVSLDLNSCMQRTLPQPDCEFTLADVDAALSCGVPDDQ